MLKINKYFTRKQVFNHKYSTYLLNIHNTDRLGFFGGF